MLRAPWAKLRAASSARVCVCAYVRVCVCGVLKFVGGMQDRVVAAGQLRYNVLALFQRRRRLRHAEGPPLQPHRQQIAHTGKLRLTRQRRLS